MPAYRTNPDYIAELEDVKAAIVNRPLAQLQDNIQYLKERIDSVVSGSALFIRGGTLDATVRVGDPVYWNLAGQRYDQALGDGTSKWNVVGLCTAKLNSTLGDICTFGFIKLDLTNQVGSPVSTVTRFFLSADTPGRLVSTPPANSVFVCLSDGKGNVLVAPQVRDVKGPQGFPGIVGPPGPAGSPGTNAGPTLINNAGTTTDTGVQAFNLSGANGIIGSLVIKNTGSANGLIVAFSATDLFNTVGAFDSVTIPPGDTWAFDLQRPLSAQFTGLAFNVLAPYKSATATVRAAVAGSQTNYQAYGSVML